MRQIEILIDQEPLSEDIVHSLRRQGKLKFTDRYEKMYLERYENEAK